MGRLWNALLTRDVYEAIDAICNGIRGSVVIRLCRRLIQLQHDGDADFLYRLAGRLDSANDACSIEPILIAACETHETEFLERKIHKNHVLRAGILRGGHLRHLRLIPDPEELTSADYTSICLVKDAKILRALPRYTIGFLLEQIDDLGDIARYGTTNTLKYLWNAGNKRVFQRRFNERDDDQSIEDLASMPTGNLWVLWRRCHLAEENLVMALMERQSPQAMALVEEVLSIGNVSAGNVHPRVFARRQRLWWGPFDYDYALNLIDDWYINVRRILYEHFYRDLAELIDGYIICA